MPHCFNLLDRNRIVVACSTLLTLHQETRFLQYVTTDSEVVLSRQLPQEMRLSHARKDQKVTDGPEKALQAIGCYVERCVATDEGAAATDNLLTLDRVVDQREGFIHDVRSLRSATKAKSHAV